MLRDPGGDREPVQLHDTAVGPPSGAADPRVAAGRASVLQRGAARLGGRHRPGGARQRAAAPRARGRAADGPDSGVQGPHGVVPRRAHARGAHGRCRPGRRQLLGPARSERYAI